MIYDEKWLIGTVFPLEIEDVFDSPFSLAILFLGKLKTYKDCDRPHLYMVLTTNQSVGRRIHCCSPFLYPDITTTMS